MTIPPMPPPSALPTLCLTSNRYVHLIPPFAWCWRHFWPDFHEPDMNVLYYDVPLPHGPHEEMEWRRWPLGVQDRYTWSAGLLKALSAFHPDATILLVLEDYWLDRPVDHAAVLHALGLMQDNPRIGKIDLSGDRLQFPLVDWIDHPDYVAAVTVSHEYREDAGFKHKLYLMSYQAALWRVGFLRDHLNPTEDPWQSEENGTRRLLDTGSLILGHRRAPLHYTQAVKAGKPTLLRRERFDATPEGRYLLDRLTKEGLLSWAQ